MAERHIDLEEALKDPGRFFDAPHEVVSAAGLTTRALGADPHAGPEETVSKVL